MAYSELIKNFEKIRGYMREFYVYGFKSREGYTKKSLRSYDDERRRVESWLGTAMTFRRTGEGKTVFLSVDNRNVPFNPLYSAWKAKSFTDRDLVLHFCLLDLLSGGAALSLREIADGVAAMLSHAEAPFEADESTVRKKLREYVSLGLIAAEKRGRALYYRVPEERVDLSSWAEALAFFSEQAPLGVIGSYLLDRLETVPSPFRYKHHYLLHTLDSQVLYDLLCAMREKRTVRVVIFSPRRGQEREHLVCPLRIDGSTQTGREYLVCYHVRFRKPMFFRLDMIRSVTPGPVEARYARYAAYLEKFGEHLWGVSAGSSDSLDHVELTVRVEEGEGFILDRLAREKRCGRVETLDEHTCRFAADVYDAMELLPWVRTFTGRIVSFRSSNSFAVRRFYGDLNAMAALYGGGEQA